MKGESLYAVWLEEIVRAGGAKRCEWKILLPSEKAAWNELAKFVESLVIKGR